jgi:Matrixin
VLSISRLAASMSAIVILLAIAAPAAAASSTRLVVAEIRMAPHAASMSTSDLGLSPPPCQDPAFNTLGGKQTNTYQWAFKASTTPSGLNKSNVANTLQKSFTNVTTAHNDCGIADNVSATDKYLGTTTLSPNCSSQDGHNVVGFSRLDFGVLAVTCFWINNGKIVEADMKITTRESWALSLSSCHGDMPMLEATVTHEAGHVFGLDHVGEKKHGRLTMSPYLDGPCNNNEATLGKGDVAGLASLY